MLDLKTEAGRRALDRLVEQADVLLHNTRPKPAARLGIDAARLHEVNPRLIHCATVGFGSDGPWADRPAYDDVVQAAGGLAALPTETGQAPASVPTIVADKIAGLHAGQAILAALVRRGRTGEGCAIEVPMFECLVAFLFNEHLDAASFDAQAAPGYRRLLNAYRRPHATREGWLAVTPYSETHWRLLLEEIGPTTSSRPTGSPLPAGAMRVPTGCMPRCQRGWLSGQPPNGWNASAGCTFRIPRSPRSASC